MTEQGHTTISHTGNDRSRSGATPLDRLFAVAIVGCVAATLLMLVAGIHGHAILPTIDLVMDTIGLVVCAALTTLAWARYRERRVIAAVYHAGAFQALAVAYGVAVLVSLDHSARIEGLSQPDDVQVLVFAVARLGAAVLFVLAGAFTGRRTYGWFPAWVLVAPTVAVVLSGSSAQPLAVPRTVGDRRVQRRVGPADHHAVRGLRPSRDRRTVLRGRIREPDDVASGT